MSSIKYRSVEFTREIVRYEDLKVFGPPVQDGWYYLGPVAVTPDGHKQRGIIVRPNTSDSDALDEVVDWKPVFIDIEGAKFSTWRGIPNNPEKYVAVGDFFVTGIEKPSPEQTKGIMAIRKDLIDEVEPSHLVFKKQIPFAVLTIWTVVMTIPLLIPTGAFVSSPGESADTKLGVIRFLHNLVEEILE